MKTIRIQEFNDQPILTGAQAGARLCAALAASLPASEPKSQPLFLDFSGVELATASFLREAILPFKAFARTVRSCWYPVVANASSPTLEELEIVCSARSDTILACNVTAGGELTDVRLCGSLDLKQREAYDFVVANGGATARALMEATATGPETSISPTAWNNRLSALVEKGIVSDASEGRQKLYTPILKVSNNGH